MGENGPKWSENYLEPRKEAEQPGQAVIHEVIKVIRVEGLPYENRVELDNCER